MTKVVELLNGRILKSDHLHRAVPGDGHDRPQRMRAIEGGAKVVAPVVRIAVSDIQPARGTVVDILTLGIGDVADVTLAVAPPHFKGQIHVAVVLGVSVDQPGLLHRLDQLDRLRHRLAWQNLRQHMLARLQATNGKGSMLGRIVRQHDGVHVILDEVIKGLKARNVQSSILGVLTRQVQQWRILITDCHQFRLGVMQQYLNHGVAPGTSEHANTQFSFHDIPFLWYEYQRSHSQYRDIYLRLRCFLCRQEPVINVMQKSRSRNAQVPAGQYT